MAIHIAPNYFSVDTQFHIQLQGSNQPTSCTLLNGLKYNILRARYSNIELKNASEYITLENFFNMRQRHAKM